MPRRLFGLTLLLLLVPRGRATPGPASADLAVGSPRSTSAARIASSCRPRAPVPIELPGDRVGERFTPALTIGFVGGSGADAVQPELTGAYHS